MPTPPKAVEGFSGGGRVHRPVGTDGYEVRKVAQYVDGRLVRVDRDHPLQGPVELGSEPVPSWTELEDAEDVHVEETSAEFFERRWQEALTGFIGQCRPSGT
ncbi:hypothetical protein AB0442_21225 [Kitasatospora sp. NPDC085895]|uniref:DUF6881 domain-containing protein n=1 Tax=Kitasatospora sp. NPDC085895 TaxID=3155057 RepID=UPI00344B6FBC